VPRWALAARADRKLTLQDGVLVDLVD
jgi:hypothetical protein